MTASTFCCAMSCSTSCALLAASDVSSRSRRSIFIFLPPTSMPPASLISLTASSVAVLYAPPIFDSLPVSGRTAPMRISLSWARAGSRRTRGEGPPGRILATKHSYEALLAGRILLFFYAALMPMWTGAFARAGQASCCPDRQERLPTLPINAMTYPGSRWDARRAASCRSPAGSSGSAACSRDWRSRAGPPSWRGRSPLCARRSRRRSRAG